MIRTSIWPHPFTIIDNFPYQYLVCVIWVNWYNNFQNLNYYSFLIIEEYYNTVSNVNIKSSNIQYNNVQLILMSYYCDYLIRYVYNSIQFASTALKSDRN